MSGWRRLIHANIGLALISAGDSLPVADHVRAVVLADPPV